MIFVVGLSFHTAPVELRECLHLADEKRVLLAEQLQRAYGLSECVVLSTCNRFEVYAIATNPDIATRQVGQVVERENALPTGTLRPYLYQQSGQEAVEHLMRVASGLDSMVLGEAQILGQVSDAAQLAQHYNTSGPILHRLFEVAVHTGKRAHSETAIGDHTTSVSHAAVLLALSQIGKRDDIRALVVGAGKMSSLAIDALRSKGITPVDVVNRTQSNAQDLAAITDGRAYGWHELHDALVNSDIIISATSAPHTVIHEPDVERSMIARSGRPQVLIDTAVPRDISEDVEMVPGAHYYNIDDLQQVVDENAAKRRACVPLVERIVLEEADKYMLWLRGREVVPAIKGLRRKVNAIAAAEMETVLGQLSGEDQAVVTKMVHRIVNKILHEPTVRLREQASVEDGEEYVYAVRELFALDEDIHG